MSRCWDSGWGRSNGDEDPDASSRLSYVAMTCARQTLVLLLQRNELPSVQYATSGRGAGRFRVQPDCQP